MTKKMRTMKRKMWKSEEVMFAFVMLIGGLKFLKGEK